MPMYCYYCPECGSVQTQFRPIVDRDRPATCHCGGISERDFVAEGSRASMNVAFTKPIEMWSIAPNTQAEHRQLVEAGATFGEGGVPLAHSRAEKLKLLEVVGHVERS